MFLVWLEIPSAIIRTFVFISFCHNLGMLDLVFENQTDNLKWGEKFFTNVLERSLELLKFNDRQVEIGLHLVGLEKSQELNREYRGKDKPTDVLSFPLNDGIEDNVLKKHDILPLGDIFICLDVAIHQAKEMNIAVSQELARLTVHGFLHLLGYDHERSPEDEKKMIELQEEILNGLKL